MIKVGVLLNIQSQMEVQHMVLSIPAILEDVYQAALLNITFQLVKAIHLIVNTLHGLELQQDIK